MAVFNAELENLIKQKNNEEVKTILKKFLHSNLVDDKGRTLLHIAAQHNNLDLIQHLLDSKYDINAKSISGTTPLLTAVLYNQFDAVKLLLNADANMLISNNANKNPLQIVLKKQRRTPDEIIAFFLKRFIYKFGNDDQAGEVLARAGCSLKSVVLADDAQLTRSLLNSSAFVSEEDIEIIMKRVVNSTDLSNLRVVLQHGAETQNRRDWYSNYLRQSCKMDHNSAKRHVAQFIEWGPTDNVPLEIWAKLLDRNYTEEIKYILKKLLNWVAHVPCDNKYKQYLVAVAFGYLNYDVIELALKTDRIEVNISGEDGFSALHFAVINHHGKNIHSLLKMGADPNARDDQGRTPLFLTNDAEYTKILLQYGADVQAIDYNGMTAFRWDFLSSQKLKIMQGHLAMTIAQGTPMDPLVCKKVKTKVIYRLCCQQIEKMKKYLVFPSFSLFDVLVAKPEHLVRYVKDEKMVSQIGMYCISQKFDFYYRSTLINNLTVALATYEIMSAVADVVSCMIKKSVDIDHLVVANIIRFVNVKDLIEDLLM